MTGFCEIHSPYTRGIPLLLERLPLSHNAALGLLVYLLPHTN